MGRHIIAALEDNYKQIDRQLKEQFIHGLNDNDILVEIIKELTKIEASKDVTSEQVLAWEKESGTQKAQSMIIHSLDKTL